MDLYSADGAPLESLAGQLEDSDKQERRGYSIAKRLLDIVISLMALLLLFPLMLMTALAIKLDSKGPLIYRQTRVCKNGKQFKLLKFRSMCQDADERRAALSHLNEKDGPIFKISQDPRITRVGRVIRKFSIDELPQLINILQGDMSVVGPRPPLLHEVTQYSAFEAQRLRVKPGLTCYWQISGRSTLSFKEWIDLDIKYISDSSIRTDLCIIIKTIPAVLFCKGAC